MGTCVRTPSGIYYLKDNKRYRIISNRVLASHSFSRIVDTTDVAVSKYKVAGRLGFRDGTLIHNISDGRLFIMEKSLKRHIQNPDILERLGVTVGSAGILIVSADELKLHKDGLPWQ